MLNQARILGENISTVNTGSSPINKSVDFYEISCLLNDDKEFLLSDMRYKLIRSVYAHLLSDEMDIVEGIDLDIEVGTMDIDLIDTEDQEEGGILSHEIITVVERESLYIQSEESNRCLIKNLQFRTEHFGDAYPFVVNSDLGVIKLKPTLSRIQKNYILTLLFSNSEYTNKDPVFFSNYFEAMSTLAMRKCFGENFKAFRFGFSDFNAEIDGPFSGITNFKDKVQILCNEAGLKIKDFDNPLDIQPGRKKERGLDVVGWLDTNDKCRASLIYFGQCCVSYEWEHKQHEPKVDRWVQWIDFNAYPVPLFFTPALVNIGNDKFDFHAEIHMISLFDRSRILSFLPDDDDSLNICFPEEVTTYINELEVA